MPLISENRDELLTKSNYMHPIVDTAVNPKSANFIGTHIKYASLNFCSLK